MASHLEMLTHDLIDRESWKCKLQANLTSGEQVMLNKRMLTPAAAVKASCHEPLASLDLVHSFNNEVMECDTLLGSSFPGVERHLSTNSAAKFQPYPQADNIMNYQKPMCR